MFDALYLAGQRGLTGQGLAEVVYAGVRPRSLHSLTVRKADLNARLEAFGIAIEAGRSNGAIWRLAILPTP